MTSQIFNRRPIGLQHLAKLCCLLALQWLTSGGIAGVAAETGDEIWLEPSAKNDDTVRFSPQRIIYRRGVIESFDDKSIRFLDTTDDGAEQSKRNLLKVPSPRVIWIEPRFEDQATVAAIASFRSGDPKDAIAPLLEAINRRPPVWLAQWLSMHLWQAAFQAQKYPATLALVNQIDSRPMPTVVAGGLPIHWTSEWLPPEALEAARKVLNAEESLEATKLVAASWIVGNQGDAQAVAVLDAISQQNTRPALAQLAKSLLWRKATPPSIRENRRQWQASLSMLPLTLVSGPSLLLADRLQASGDNETSLELLLSAGVTPPRPHYITRTAKQRAVELLNQLGQPDAADRIADSKPPSR